MRRSADFAHTVRSGLRTRRGALVVHRADADPAGSPVPVVGFVVGKAVGRSVVRHRVTRRLRALAGTRLATLPAGSRTVVRALPGAAGATTAQLGADLDAALDRLDTRTGR
jgi:ribonuclease P protein component